MPEPKHILIYSASVTWGMIPASGRRHAYKDRWPQVVEAGLGGSVRITTEALPGRTTVWDEPFRAGRNGRADFLMLLQSHVPVDLVVILLGVNDLQTIYPAGACEAAQGVGLIAQDALSHLNEAQDGTIEVLIVAPPRVIDCENSFAVMEGAAEQSLKLAGELQKVASELNCHFFDASRVVETSTDDGVHLDRENTIALGRALISPIKQALEG